MGFSAALWAFASMAGGAAASPAPVKIGVLAFRPKPQTLAQWRPLAAALKRAMPTHDFVVEAFTFSELETAIAGKQVDFVLTDPSHYVLLANRKGLSAPIATLVNDEHGHFLSMFGGVIFSKTGNKLIGGLSDLKGRRVAVTNIDSLGDFQMQAYELALTGIRFPNDAEIVPTEMPQDNVVEAVLNDKADAGFVRTGVLETMTREGRLDITRIKVLHAKPQPNFPWAVSSGLYPEWPFSVMPHVDDAIARHVAAALFRVEDDSVGARALGIHGFTIPADYKPVENLLRELRLPPFDAAPRFTARDVWDRYRILIFLTFLFGVLVSVLGARLFVLNGVLDAARHVAQQQTQQATQALESLREAQAQLVQSEKMASLGQLIANVAHEINTPIGAVKASGENIAGALAPMLEAMPRLYRMLDQQALALFMKLLDHGRNKHSMLSSREERAAVREVATLLEEGGIDEARYKAGVLVQLQAQAAAADYLPLLRHAENKFILDSAQSVASIVTNTGNINTAVSRISKIVFALKSFARSGGGGEMTEAMLQEGLETTLTIYQHQIRQGTELVCRYAEMPPLRCLPDELNQVWTNLIHNALQAMNNAGTLTVDLKRVGDEAVVSIGDTGSGIPEEIRGRIFEAFFTTKPMGEGSGLGLDIVKKIVDKHKGRIDVQSEVGVGSTFTVYLPYASEATV